VGMGRAGRREAALATAMLTAVAVAGCSSSSNAASPETPASGSSRAAAVGPAKPAATRQPAASASFTMGTLEGTVRAFGGPPNPTHPHGLAGQPIPNWSVVVRGAGGRQYKAATDGHGRYRIRLAAGRYTFTSMCGMSARVSVAAGLVTSHDLACPLV
jgi:hypothetical protein